MTRGKRRLQTITVRPRVWGARQWTKQGENKRILTDANFVTVCEAALRLEGPVDDIAANVKHGYRM